LARAEELSSKGDYEGAIELLVAALDSPSLRQHRGAIAEAHYQLAAAHNNLGDYVTALRFAQQAEVGFRRSGMLHESAVAAAGVGTLQSTLEQHEEGAKTLLRALALFRRVGDERRQASALLSLGTGYARRGRTVEGIAALLEAERLAAKIGADAYRALALNNLGGTYLKMRDYAKSREYLLRAIELIRKQSDPLNEAAALGMLARAELGLGDVPAASARAQRALVLVEAERSRLLTPELQATLAGSFQPVYDAMVQAQLGREFTSADEPRLEAAFRISDGARARMLLDRLAKLHGEVERSAAPTDLAELQRLKAELLPRASSLVANDVTLVKYRQLEAKVRAATAAGRALTAPPQAGFSDIRGALLAPRGTLLEYWLGEERSVLWAIGTNSARAYALPGREEIERLAREYVAVVRDRSPDGSHVEVLGAQLADAILPVELQESLERGRLLLVTHGALDLVPFAALPVQSAPTTAIPTSAPALRRPMVEEFEIAHVSSAAAAVAAARAEGRPSDRRRIGVFANPALTALANRQDALPAALRSASTGRLDALGPLPYTAAEAQAIAAASPDKAVDLWLDRDATRNRVLASVGKYRIVHFATHGLVSADQPETSGLVLSPDRPFEAAGYLGLADVYTLNLDAELVVLSACNTAVGRQIRGEGLVSLTHGFLSAGARRVIATLWQVNDRSTSTLMAALYAEILGRSQSASGALRAAQLQQRREPATRHPYYWAAFRVYGQ
jgi:tetratricopeptide (TPR) repeat protein